MLKNIISILSVLIGFIPKIAEWIKLKKKKDKFNEIADLNKDSSSDDFDKQL